MTATKKCRRIILLSVLCMFVCGVGYAADSTSQADRDTLMQLDHELDAEANLNWYPGPGDTTTGWNGVTWSADLADARVTGINAGNKGLTGSSDEWRKFALLEVLHLEDNKLTSLDVSRNFALRYLDVSRNKDMTTLTTVGNTAIREIHASNTGLNRLDVSSNTALTTLNVNANAMPLSQLYSYMHISNLWTGEQNDVAFAAFGGALATGTAYDVGIAERVIGGANTVFVILRADNSTALENVDYTIADGIVTFLNPGDYILSMENENVYSKGTVSYTDEHGVTSIFDFDSAANPYGQANPLAVVRTGRLSVLGDSAGDRFLVKVEHAGASVNALDLVAKLNTAVFDNRVVLGAGELGQLYSAALAAPSGGESLHIVNQMHLESVAGGMDAILRTAAQPFINSLHSRAGKRIAGDSLGYAAANSWSAYAQVAGSASGGGYGCDAGATGLGQYADMSGHDGFLGYDVRNYGAMAGMDKLFPEGRFGFALGYSHSKVKWDDFDNKADSDNFHAGLYASRFYDGFAFTAQANLGYADVDSIRRLPAVNAAASGDYHMWWYGAGLSVAHAFDLGSCLTLTPSLGLDYLHSRSSSFTEKGAGTASASVASQNRDQVDGRLTVELAKTFFSGATRITPSVNAGLGYSMLDRQSSVDYRFAGAPNLPTFRASGAKLDRARLLVGAAVDIGISDRVSLAASYQGDFQSNYKSHFFHIGVGVHF